LIWWKRVTGKSTLKIIFRKRAGVRIGIVGRIRGAM